MKLKIKLPLLFCVMVALMTIVLAVYLRLNAFQAIFHHVFDIKEEQQAMNTRIAGDLERLLPLGSGLRDYANRTAQAQGIVITMYDSKLSGEPLLTAGMLPADSNLNTSWFPIWDAAQNISYFVKFDRPIQIRDFTERFVFTKSLTFMVIALLIISCGLAIYFHYFITKPIDRLNRRLAVVSYSQTLPPIESARKDEIGELYRHVREMEERIEEHRAEQVRIVGAIAHDLKTPLTSMGGFLELLRTQIGLPEERKAEYLRLVQKKSDQITELVQQFSAFGKSELQLRDIKLEPIAIASLFESIADEYETELSGFEHRLIAEHRFREEDRIRANGGMLRRVFANLIGNAVRYGDKDELIVRMIGWKEGGRAIMAIEDDGIGVPSDAQPHLFHLFYTVDQARQSEKGGTGLGLAACKSIIEHHGGRISAYTAPSGGLGIRLEVPLA